MEIQLWLIFDGYWQEGKKIRGVYHYSDGSTFTGNWSDDQRNGDGELKYPDGRVYTGPFEDDEVKGEPIPEKQELRAAIPAKDSVHLLKKHQMNRSNKVQATIFFLNYKKR